MAIDMRVAADLVQEQKSNAGTGRRRLQLKNSWFDKPPGVQDRILFTERLALQIETGVALHRALQSLSEQTEKDNMKAVINSLIDTVVSGGKFSDALAKHSRLFPSTYTNLVAVGENGGFLAEVLEQLKEMDEKQQRLHSTIISAFTYPAFLAFFSVAVVLFVLTVVFPKFATIFSSMHGKLPMSTKVLMWMSEMLLQHPILILLAVSSLLGLAAAWIARPAGMLWRDRMKLRAPVLRKIYVQIYITRLMRTMGISLQHGVTILSTLQACREVVANVEFQNFIAKLETDVSEGKGIAAGFTHSDFIPATVMQMIATGEETGNLGHVMNRLADFYDRELTKQLNRMAKMAEPIMLLVMGSVVGIIVSSLILPIFKMSSAMH